MTKTAHDRVAADLAKHGGELYLIHVPGERAQLLYREAPGSDRFQYLRTINQTTLRVGAAVFLFDYDRGARGDQPTVLAEVRGLPRRIRVKKNVPALRLWSITRAPIEAAAPAVPTGRLVPARELRTLRPGDLITHVDGQLLTRPHTVAGTPVLGVDDRVRYVPLDNYLYTGSEWRLYPGRVHASITVEPAGKPAPAPTRQARPARPATTHTVGSRTQAALKRNPGYTTILVAASKAPDGITASTDFPFDVRGAGQRLGVMTGTYRWFTKTRRNGQTAYQLTPAGRIVAEWAVAR